MPTDGRSANVITNAEGNDYGNISNKTFANNVLNGSFSHNYNMIGGSAILNQGIIGDVAADFVGNRTTTSTGNSYRTTTGAVANVAKENGKTAQINSITGDFIGNLVYGSGYILGGAISNYVIGKDSTVSIGSIEGDFVGNSSFSTNYHSYGGAISNCVTAGSINITVIKRMRRKSLSRHLW